MRSLINLYNAYIYPYLIYCVESWGNVTKCHLDQLYILIEKIVRLITVSNYSQAAHVPSKYIFRELQVLPLYNTVQTRISFMMYKLLNGFLHNKMSEICLANNELPDYFIIQFHFLYTRKGRNHVSTRRFNHIGPPIWNSLQKKVNVLVPIAKLKIMSKVFFSMIIISSLITGNSSLGPYLYILLTF